MCLSPIRLKDRTIVACRGCTLCRDNRLNDLIGRCVAEQKISSLSLSVTLTYAGDTPFAVILYYRHIQNMLKSLRTDGYKVRYICAGEYGEKKGRAHWHIVLFFQGKAPAYELNTRINWKYWPHGFSYFQQPDYKGFRYVMKYALKQENGVKSLAMSKKPPLGYDFFIRMAGDIVDRRLPIHSPEYSFLDVRDKNQVPRRYWLQGRMREMFLEHYVSSWRNQYNEEPPYSDFLVETYLDKIARAELELDPTRYERDRDYRDLKFHTELVASRARDFQSSLAKRHVVSYVPLEFGETSLLVVYSDQTAELFYGKDTKPWLLSASVNVAAQLLASGLPRPSATRVSDYLTALWSAPGATSPASAPRP